jgi:hypothetical protein
MGVVIKARTSGLIGAALLSGLPMLLSTTPAAAVPTPSATFGGYQMRSDALTGMSAVMTVPKVRCGEHYSALASGITFNAATGSGGYRQTARNSVAVWSTCEADGEKHGSLRQRLYVFADGSSNVRQLVVAPGQKISMAIRLVAGKVTVTGTDLNTNHSLRSIWRLKGFTSTYAQVGAWPIENGMGFLLPISAFSGDAFSSVFVGGKRLGDAPRGRYLLARNFVVLVGVSVITSKTVFHLTFAHH